MKRYIYDDDVEVVGRDGGSTIASNIIWALVTLLIVGAILYTIFFTPLLRTNPVHKYNVDVNVSAPAVNR